MITHDLSLKTRTEKGTNGIGGRQVVKCERRAMFNPRGTQSRQPSWQNQSLFQIYCFSVIAKILCISGFDLTIIRWACGCSPPLPLKHTPSMIKPGNCGQIIASILCWKLEYWIPWRARQFCGQSSSFVPGVVRWMKYTFCTVRVLLLPLPGNTGYSEACKHFEFGVAPQIARFRRLLALWTDSKTVFTRHTWN